MSKTIITHKHHIIPKHMGGTDDPSNIVEITVEEHAEAHRVLYEKYGRWQDELAWKGLAGIVGKEEIIRRAQSEANKGRKHSEEYCRKQSERMKGENNPCFGRTGEKNPMFGRRGKNNPNFGKKRSEESKRKQSEKMEGRNLSEEHRRKIGESQWKVCVSPEGVVYASLREAARQSPHPYNTLRDWCHANKNGWYWKDSPPTNLDNFSA
jgi:hypothetical protein